MDFVNRVRSAMWDLFADPEWTPEQVAELIRKFGEENLKLRDVYADNLFIEAIVEKDDRGCIMTYVTENARTNEKFQLAAAILFTFEFQITDELNRWFVDHKPKVWSILSYA